MSEIFLILHTLRWLQESLPDATVKRIPNGDLETIRISTPELAIKGRIVSLWFREGVMQLCIYEDEELVGDIWVWEWTYDADSDDPEEFEGLIEKIAEAATYDPGDKS